MLLSGFCPMVSRSHPTMGAWIEINKRLSEASSHSLSHPTMGAWIEISGVMFANSFFAMSHPTMGAWIEISTLLNLYLISLSHPTMGAWIEIWLHPCPVSISLCRTPRWVRGLKSHPISVGR